MRRGVIGKFGVCTYRYFSFLFFFGVFLAWERVRVLHSYGKSNIVGVGDIFFKAEVLGRRRLEKMICCSSS